MPRYSNMQNIVGIIRTSGTLQGSAGLVILSSKVPRCCQALSAPDGIGTALAEDDGRGQKNEYIKTSNETSLCFRSLLYLTRLLRLAC